VVFGVTVERDLIRVDTAEHLSFIRIHFKISGKKEVTHVTYVKSYVSYLFL